MSSVARTALEVPLPPGFALVEAPHPTSLDDADAWAYRAVADIGRELELEVHGYDDLALRPRDVLSGMDHQEYAAKRRFVVVRSAAAGALVADGVPPAVPDVVAHLFVSRPTTSNEHLGEAYPFVRPGERGRGIGTALLSLGEHLNLDAGRTVLFSDTAHGEEPAPGPGAIEATTGAGRVPADAPGPRFLQARGYVLEQVERHSVLDLPVASEALDTHRGAASEHAGPDYRVHTWTDEVPDAWLDQVAVLFTRMSTDAPTGGVEYGEDPWDARRVRTWVGEQAEKRNGFLVSAAEHAPTGALAAFTVFAYPRDRDDFAFQEDTLVLREHRGRRLGMLVKVANLDALADERPTTRRVHTWNAQENDHMLAINVALGFRPAGVWAAWQRRTTPEDGE
ncbi:GNAT superfamily N-acetyltransferase [Cellulosimicrobium cellulans]|uniref:GNAT family N-acetyltransferase n=1 Tax=Cellulosimicrobium cellulans TaxID=1710 RepID=UPI00195EFEEF|nr:GNAT family N-acetyltransferase [Cellulosimicrobium cellulans]MBM7821440.1 GNAT superfamily N-acetyltransferase [Cellulosimicrobium cellulans]